MTMNIILSDYNVSNNCFIEKVRSDLKSGVEIIAGRNIERTVIRVWTDIQGWQFSISGLRFVKNPEQFGKIQIQSFGESEKYLQLTWEKLNKDINVSLEKLSESFAELSGVGIEETNAFIQAYMQSTFNKLLTKKLYGEINQIKGYKSWIVS